MTTTIAKKGMNLTVKNIQAFYGESKAVKGVSIDFPANKITALIGPSGCGKSTLVRCLNRMHEEGSSASVRGKVLLNEENIYGADVDPVSVRRTIGMVFQKPNPFPTMSILDNVLAGPRLSGDRAHATRKHAEQALRDVGLWAEVKHKLNRPAADLSGGQQQRLCIARAIALEPEVLLMDEPCSALDPISTQRIEELVLRLKKRFTIVMVTHNLQQAQRLADRTAFMLDGELIEVAATSNLFNKPKDSRTKKYVTGQFG